jgi:nitrite reductase (NADH) large subunit
MFHPFEVPKAKPAEPPTEGPAAWRCTICDYVHQGPEPPAVCPVCGATADMFEPQQEPAPEPAGGAGPRLVILGAGIAGFTAADHARRQAPDAQITLLSKEPELPYYRLNLTRYLAGQVPAEGLSLKPQEWFDEQRIVLEQGEATRIQRRERRVLLGDGRELEYERLILANGSHPFVPPIPGVTREGVCTVRTMTDARQIIDQARQEARCVCIGGGLLGLEAAGALQARGLEVTVVEGFDWLLPRQLAQSVSQLLQRHLEGLGVAVRCGVRVKAIVGDEAAKGVILAEDDELLPAELVLVAAGVRPNSYLARQSQLEVKQGVIVDDHMQTSDPEILAAGDVAEHRGVVYGLWPTAYAQGAVAGINAAGGQAEFSGLPPSTMLKVLDVGLFSVGQVVPTDGSFQVLEGGGDGAFHRLVCRDGRLIGANLFGDTLMAVPIREAVEQGTQISELAEILGRYPELSETCKC